MLDLVLIHATADDASILQETYVVETLAAKYLLSEKVPRTRWAVALCVCLGVALISL